MPGMFTFELVGAKELDMLLNTLPDKAAQGVIRPVLKRSADRIDDAVIANISGRYVEQRTGTFVIAMLQQRVKYFRTRSGFGYKMALPTREQLHIAPDDEYFYPTVLEYGAPHMTARAPLRRAVDDNREWEIGIVSREIKQGVSKKAERLARKAAKGAVARQ